MPVRLIDQIYQRHGVTVTVRDVPVEFHRRGHELGQTAQVFRAVQTLVEQALDQRAPDAQTVQVDYRPPGAPGDAVSLELRRAMRRQGVNGRTLAERLGVKAPVVARWLSPGYHGHRLTTLRRIAEALELTLEVRLVPRPQHTGRAYGVVSRPIQDRQP